MPVLTFGPNEVLCVPETSDDDVAPALLARTIPPGEAFPDVPPPEPPVAATMPARTTGNAATRTSLRCRPSRASRGNHRPRHSLPPGPWCFGLIGRGDFPVQPAYAFQIGDRQN